MSIFEQLRIFLFSNLLIKLLTIILLIISFVIEDNVDSENVIPIVRLAALALLLSLSLDVVYSQYHKKTEAEIFCIKSFEKISDEFYKKFHGSGMKLRKIDLEIYKKQKEKFTELIGKKEVERIDLENSFTYAT